MRFTSLIIILHVVDGSQPFLEEIDNGIHPSRATIILQNIERVARERDLRVLLTTHNPALLDTLPNRALPNVVACYRNPENGSSELIRLDDLHEYPALLARGSLGRSMTTGILDRYLKSQRTPLQRKNDNLEWLKSFEKEVSVPA